MRSSSQRARGICTQTAGQCVEFWLGKVGIFMWDERANGRSKTATVLCSAAAEQRDIGLLVLARPQAVQTWR